MKRETVLFYLTNGKIQIYLVNAKKEITVKTDTSLFFKFGEISDVSVCSDTIMDVINSKNILKGILKPSLKVLYNGNTNADLKYLYKSALLPFNYNSIDFIDLNEIIKFIKDDERVIVFDKDYYTFYKDGKKTSDIDYIDFEPILIGIKKSENIHFSDINIIWNTFKSHFTKE